MEGGRIRRKNLPQSQGMRKELHPQQQQQRKSNERSVTREDAVQFDASFDDSLFSRSKFLDQMK